MLYAVTAGRWVSGIFDRERGALDYLQEVPEADRAKHTLRHLEGLHYPVYIVEDSAGFRFMAEEAALEDVRTHTQTENEEDCCLTLYRIDRDYRPQVAGEDEMGGLNHQHVDNEVLALVQRDGRAGLRIMAEWADNG